MHAQNPLSRKDRVHGEFRGPNSFTKLNPGEKTILCVVDSTPTMLFRAEAKPIDIAHKQAVIEVSENPADTVEVYWVIPATVRTQTVGKIALQSEAPTVNIGGIPANTDVVDTRGAVLLVQRELFEKSEGESGSQFLQQGEEIAVGRSNVNFDFSENVSRKHVSIGFSEHGEITAQDLESTNGTFVRTGLLPEA